jgi:uncharacterized protein YutE (UPF0331/DUF86 family)
MKELHDFRKVLNTLNESDNIINSNDFGLTQNMQDKDHISGLTYLEKGMAEIYGDIAAHGITVAKAKKFVSDAIEELIASKVIPELPNEADSDGKKAMWLSMARPRITAHLKLNSVIM